MKNRLKKWGTWIVIAVFWIGVAVTFIGGCVGIFLKSSDEPQEDYEEYIHSNVP